MTCRAPFRCLPSLMALCLSAASAGAIPAPIEPEELKKLSLEDLANVDVSLAFRAPHAVADTPAAVFVLSREDIRRSGATSVPEALRLVPGIAVNRIGSNLWAIVARFPNGRFSNKFLVLVDGRTVYTPLFGGTFWDIAETLLEDVEKIEVIRGAGAALWGSNGITGVIHVITRKSGDTPGNLGSVTAGNHEQFLGGFRHGGKLNNGGTYRVTARTVNRDSFDLTNGATADDAWNVEHGSFRADWSKGRDSFTAQGGFHDVDSSRRLFRPVATAVNAVVPQNDDAHGGHLVARGKRVVSPREDWTLQLYLDGTDRREVAVLERRLTSDIDLVHRFENRHGSERVSGLGVRVSGDRIRGTPGFLDFNPANRQIALYSSFVQQRWPTLAGRGSIVAGTRLEHNPFTGLEVQPTVRGTYRLDAKHMVWGAVSRAVRIPSRSNDDVRVNVLARPPGFFGRGTPAAVVTAFGSRDVDSEVLITFESGLRAEVGQRLSLDLTLFRSSFTGLISFARPAPNFLIPGPPVTLVVPRFATNGTDADVAGAELAATLRPRDRWTLHLAYSFVDMEFTTLGLPDPVPPGFLAKNQLSVRSQHDLSSNWQLDLFAQYQDSLRSAGVPSHVRTDVRLGWRDADRLEVDLVAQNVFDPGHTEFGREFFLDPVNNTEIGRSVYGKVVRRF